MSSQFKVFTPFGYNPGKSPDTVTYLQGIKGLGEAGHYLVVGANNSSGPTPTGLVYQGPLDDVQNNGISGSGQWTEIAVPQKFHAAGTSIYGPDVLTDGGVQYVGAYNKANPLGLPRTSANPAIVGFAYTGRPDGSTDQGWHSIQGITQSGLPGTFTYVHSVDGHHAVGNTDNYKKDEKTGYFSVTSTAFVLDIKTGRQTAIRYPEDRNPLITHTAYGVWDNEDGSYTIAGGSGEVASSSSGKSGESLYPSIGNAYLIDYDPATRQFFNYQTFNETDNIIGSSAITHFEGIYRDSQGDYYLPATSVTLGDQSLTSASVVKVKRRDDGSFSKRADWSRIDVIDSTTDSKSLIATGNSLFADATVGFSVFPGEDNNPLKMSFVAELLGNTVP